MTAPAPTSRTTEEQKIVKQVKIEYTQLYIDALAIIRRLDARVVALDALELESLASSLDVVTRQRDDLARALVNEAERGWDNPVTRVIIIAQARALVEGK